MDAQGQTMQIGPTKASYIRGFLEFVDWKEQSEKTQITIGVIGAIDVANILQKAASNQETSHRLRIVKLDTLDGISELDVLFIGRGYREHWQESKLFCKKNKTLLIGEEEGFIESGGCIEFIIRKNRVRFIVSPENLSEHGMRASSKLVEVSYQER